MHSLPRVKFLDGDVLVRSGVKHHLGTKLLQDPANSLSIPYVHQKTGCGYVLEALSALHLHPEEIELTHFQKGHSLGLKAAHLPHKLASNGPPGTSHQNSPLAQVTGDLLLIEAYFLPAQKVLQGHLANGLDRYLSPDQLPHPGHGPVALPSPVAGGNDPPHLLTSSRGNGDKDLVELAWKTVDLFHGSQDRDSMDGLSHLARVIIKKPHRLEVEPGIVPDLPQNLLSRIPGADDQELPSPRSSP